MKGVHIKLAFIAVVTMEIAAAFFPLVCPHTLPQHPRMRLFAAQVPIAKATMETYRPVTPVVMAQVMKPMVACALESVRWRVRSLNLPEDQETRIVMASAMRYGGQVRRRVVSRVNPRVSITVGNCKGVRTLH
jgi:hypothetical protein